MRKALTFKFSKQNILTEPVALDLSANSSLKRPHILSNPRMKSLMLISLVYLPNVVLGSTYGVTLHDADSVCDTPRGVDILQFGFLRKKKAVLHSNITKLLGRLHFK